MLYFEEEGEISLGFDCEKLAEKVINAALFHIGCPYKAQINLLLTQDRQIHRLNAKFRRIDRTTDVLSFPAVEYEKAGDFASLKKRKECFDPETGELILGDIAVSKEKTLEQAENYGHSIKREFAFLIVHSVLHLTGYDHIRENDREIMEREQREILENLGIIREGNEGVV